jgi:hypothetical protein
MTEKHCSRCDRTLPIESFYVRKGRTSRRCYCKACCGELTVAYQRNNKSKVARINKKSWDKNREQRMADILEWRFDNKDKVCLSKRKYNTKRRSTPVGKVRDSISSGIRRIFKGGKAFKMFSVLPYTSEQVVAHLIKTIPTGYTLDDFMSGKLHIDHIIPVSAFNITDENCIDFKKCWELNNLRLLPAHDNLVKWNKLDKPFQPSLAIAI